MSVWRQGYIMSWTCAMSSVLKPPVLERVNLSPFSEGYEFLDEGEGGSGDC